MRKIVTGALAIAGLLAAIPSAVRAEDAAACHTPRLSDIGWSDVTATTTLTSQVLKSLGYTPKVTLLSVPVTYESLKTKKIDIFLGNWMPIEQAVRQRYLDDHSIEVVRANLEDAKTTLATPAYAYDAGLKSFADIARFSKELHGQIYGIEAGSGANGHVLDMIHHDTFRLGHFQLVESSEQGMLAEVQRAYRAHQPIVFLGWEPHPMNILFQMRYLDGGDAVFGPNYGGATVYTNVRSGYLQECPNVGRFLGNLKFTLAMEDEIMNHVLTDRMSPEKAAWSWLQAHPGALDPWLDGVTTADGQPGLEAVKKQLGS